MRTRVSGGDGREQEGGRGRAPHDGDDGDGGGEDGGGEDGGGER
ncbi:hypothetical protein [Streptomyces griseomycini]|nr:hypothetical protein [Streptomyces griseomycini]